MARIVKNADERRSELITAAQQLFYTKGYEKTSINDIVKAVGVAKGTFYYYFGSKQDILEAMSDAMAQQSVDSMNQILDDDSLSLFEKWHLFIRTQGSWELEHKEEIIALLQMLERDENILLKYKINESSLDVVNQQFVKLIVQGIDDGVFEVAYPSETADILISIFRGLQDQVVELILDPAKFENTAELVQRRFDLAQAAVEKILGAEAGSLPFTDDDTIQEWFSAG